MALRIGELLIAAGRLTQPQLQEALAQQKQSGEKLGEILVRLGFVDENFLIKTLAKQLHLLQIELDAMEPVPAEILAFLPEAQARRLKTVPLRLKGQVLVVVMTDPSNKAQVEEVAKLTGHKIEAMISPPSQILRMIDRSYGRNPA